MIECNMVFFMKGKVKLIEEMEEVVFICYLDD